MTTTAAGDAAVARLNKATEAFEKIITGASNQVVDVPGYGNQPTLAGRVDQRLDETTATAAAEADRSRDEADRATTQATAAANSVTQATAEYNKAKTQADRAQSEADRAAQITGLDTVSDAVALAALPLPDVWAPLSDSLRMITGYGRDVLVGSDVVARMVNFSRSTTKTYWGKDGQFKVAGANDPAFELEGLLLEGQSQNLVVYSEGATFFTANASFQTLTNNVSGVLPMTGQRISFATNNGETNANLIQTSLTLTGGQTYTYSTHLKVEAGDTSAPENCIGIYAANGVDIGARAVIRKTGDGIYRVSVSFTVSGTGNQTVFIRFNRIGAPSAVWTAVVGGVQVENLPFASSYIPTNGAAVTRAADKAWLNVAGNLIPLSVIALEFNSMAPSSFYQAPNLTRYIAHTGDGTGITAYLGRFTTQFEDSGAAQGSTISQGRTVVVGGVSGGKAAIRSGAGLVSGVAVKGFKQTEMYLCNSGAGPADRQVFGHVRNLRMYHRDLTADQYKAVA